MSKKLGDTEFQQKPKSLFVCAIEAPLGLDGKYLSADAAILIEPYLWTNGWYGTYKRPHIYICCAEETPELVAKKLSRLLRQLTESLVNDGG